MRFTTAYYLLLIYVTVTVKPLIPIFSDALSHEFNEIEHISRVHARYGSHHLQKELADSNSGDDKGTGQNTLKSEDQVPFHLIIPQCITYGLALNKSSNHYVHFNVRKLPLLCILKPGPPPKFS